jgi:HTH-type transcriptional regulator/antitoxin HigA
METINASIDMKLLLPAWEQFRSATDLAPIRDEAHYARVCTLLEALLDEVSADEAHPLMGLVDIVGNLVADHETRHHTLPEVSGVQAL